MKFTLLLLVGLCLLLSLSVSVCEAKSVLKPASVVTKARAAANKRFASKLGKLSKLSGGSSLMTATAREGAVVANNDVGNKLATGFAGTNFMQLLIGAGGIYAAFLYYGALQEDVFQFTALDGSKFKSAWFLQAVEALANILFGLVGLALTGFTQPLPQQLFALSGVAQVCAKAFTSLALASGVSFPIVTLAKSGKMVPVMLGSLLLGGATYSLRQYASVASIIAGTVLVSLGNKSKPGAASSMLGLAFIMASLACDGITGGVQKRLKVKTKELGVKPKPADFMFWTNLYMSLAAVAVSLVIGDFNTGLSYCAANPVILNKILKFALCTAVGQSFIFYTISEFDPLVCSTVTTTRKVFSVLLSILLHGHTMSAQGWAGISLAFAGIISELFDKKH